MKWITTTILMLFALNTFSPAQTAQCPTYNVPPNSCH